MTYRGAALAGAAVPLALALLGLTAWATGALRFASFRADYIPMAPSTAFGFVLVSATLIGRAFDPRDHARNATRAAATLLSLLAVIKLIEFFTGAARLNLEAVLVERPGAFGAVPLARMSPLTAVSLLMVGLALAMQVAAAVAIRRLGRARW